MPHPLFKQVRPGISAIADDVVAMRRDFHRHPELSWEESRTQACVLEHLRAIPGLEDVRPIAKTGATALVRGARPGPAVLWRADMDALPIPERSALPFASANPGVMHACGHDAHVAIALGLTRIFAARRGDLAGAVRFVFQPAEEHDGGAEACIADGVLDTPNVDRVLGLHISADIPIGAINVAPGPFFAESTYFKAVITGRGGHGAAPHQSVDAIAVAAQVITALQTVVSRNVAPTDAAVLTVGTIQGGYRDNVIAESVTFTGTIRSYTDEIRTLVIRRANEIVSGVAASLGASATFEHFRGGCPPVVNDAGVAAFVAAQADAFFGPGRTYALPSMGADDMAVFLQKRPGAYFWLGARNEAKGIAGRHHDPGFMIDEDAITLGLEFGARLIEGQLATLAR